MKKLSFFFFLLFTSYSCAVEIRFSGSHDTREARNICYLHSSWPMDCACTRVRFSDGSSWIDVKCRCHGGHRSQVVFRSGEKEVLKTALPSGNNRVRLFHLEDCGGSVGLVLGRGALSRPRAVRTVRFSRLAQMVVEEGALAAKYSHSAYVKKLSLDISEISNLTLSGGSISGNGFRSISVSKSRIDVLETETFQALNLDVINISGNVVGRIKSGSVGDRVVVASEFSFVNNTVLGVAAPGIFQPRVGRAASVSGNLFRDAKNGAFGGIRSGSGHRGVKATLSLEHNSFEAWEKGVLKPEDSFLDDELAGRVTLKGIFLGTSCSCEDLVLELQLLGEETDYPNAAVYQDLENKLVSAMNCLDANEDVVAYSYFKKECKTGTTEPTPGKTDKPQPTHHDKGASICDFSGCTCIGAEVKCVCKAQFTSRLVIGNTVTGLGTKSFWLPSKIKSLSVVGCSGLILEMASVVFTLEKVTLEGIDNLTLVGLKYPGFGANMPNKLHFKVSRSSFKDGVLNDNTFRGDFFDSIQISDSFVGAIDRLAFRDLSGTREILLDGLDVPAEVESGAFSDVEATDSFVMQNSRIGEISREAFRITFGKLFKVHNVSVSRAVEEGAFRRVKPAPPASGGRKTFAMTSLVAGRFDPGSLVLNSALVSIINDSDDSRGRNRSNQSSHAPGEMVFSDNRVETPCECSGYRVSSLSEVHHRDNGTLSSLAERLECRHDGLGGDGGFLAWGTFDEHHCDDHSDHHHSHQEGPEEHEDRGVLTVPLSGAYAAIGTVLALATLVLAVMLVVCFRAGTRRRRATPLRLPVLPTGEDNGNEEEDDDWRRVSFTRVISREEQDRLRRRPLSADGPVYVNQLPPASSTPPHYSFTDPSSSQHRGAGGATGGSQHLNPGMVQLGVRTHRVSAMTVTDEVTDETEVFFGPVLATVASTSSSTGRRPGHRSPSVPAHRRATLQQQQQQRASSASSFRLVPRAGKNGREIYY